MLINARNCKCSIDINEEAGEAELRLNDFDHYDESLHINSIITTFQYFKDKYMKNGKIHITLNPCQDSPNTS
jgi:hypothetical protein